MEALTKLPVEGELYINENDREMSRFVMNRIDQCFRIPDDFVCEVMVNGIKRYKTIHGESVSLDSDYHDFIYEAVWNSEALVYSVHNES